MPEKEYHLMWNMTRRCNFRCKYCYFPHQAQAEPNPITSGEIGDFLDRSGHQWVVEMTGGEPFLYPGFVDICRRITRKHKISLDSNLSLHQEIARFAELIDPAKVVDIYAAVHIEERRRLGLLDQFIADVLLLKGKGFMVSVNYVIHPTLIEQYLKDAAYFMEKGIRLLPRPFKGRYQGVDYPAGYGGDAKGLFAKKLKAGKKAVFNFKGVPCEAGSRLLRLEPDRSILRCSGDRTKLGTLGGELKIHQEPQPCQVARCPCFGPDYVRLNPWQDLQMQGLMHLLAGDSENRAHSLFEQVLEGDPEASNALNNLALILRRQGRRQDALPLMLKAVGLSPQHKTYVLNAAAALAETGRMDEAMDICRNLLARRTDREVQGMLARLESSEVPEFPDLVCVDLIPADHCEDLFPEAADA